MFELNHEKCTFCSVFIAIFYFMFSIETSWLGYYYTILKDQSEACAEKSTESAKKSRFLNIYFLIKKTFSSKILICLVKIN